MTNGNHIPQSGNMQDFDIRKTMNKYDIGSVPGSSGFWLIFQVLQRIQCKEWWGGEGLLQAFRVMEIKVLLVSCVDMFIFQFEHVQCLDGL